MAWVLGDPNADSGDESVQVKARHELTELYAVHRPNVPLSALTQRQLSSRLFVFRKVRRAHAQARSQITEIEALVREATGDLS